MSDTPFHNDAGVEPIERALHSLGKALREQPDAEFEARIADAVRREVLAPPPLSFARAGARAWWRSHAVLAAAAMLLIVGSAVVLLLSSKPASRPVPGPIAQVDPLSPAEEVDELIATVAWLREDLPDLASLEERAASIGELDEALFDQAEDTLLDTEDSI
ncbi:MAG: hypothetical protein DYG94_02605 [Leptolyngbya sp. PLA3]|nr:MAG: hypothetical protein EDM82_01950 [Cyanobacteria bacterium CYA]MCE7967618.1 hypothetical protein [Leptolyngbya sp. PL-A3]